MYGDDVTVADLMAPLGLSGTPGQRAEPMLRALGIDPQHWVDDPIVGSADRLASWTRQDLINVRDVWLGGEGWFTTDAACLDYLARLRWPDGFTCPKCGVSAQAWRIGSDIPAHVTLYGAHTIASLLKRWLEGTLHQGISNEHLGYYLDEFTFRFNRRASRSRGLLFCRPLQQAVTTAPAPLPTLVAAHEDPGG